MYKYVFIFYTDCLNKKINMTKKKNKNILYNTVITRHKNKY